MKSFLLCAALASFAGFVTHLHAQAAPPTVNAAPAPVLSADQKLAIRDAQHKLDAVEKQMQSLDAQFQKYQTQAKSQYDSLTTEQKKDQADVDAATAAAFKSAGIDQAKFDFDAESMTFKAKPAPNTKAQAEPLKK